MINIKCTIRTPQFKNGEVDRYHTQSGTFNLWSSLFTPSGYYKSRDHQVQFRNYREFKKYRIK